MMKLDRFLYPVKSSMANKLVNSVSESDSMIVSGSNISALYSSDLKHSIK